MVRRVKRSDRFSWGGPPADKRHWQERVKDAVFAKEKGFDGSLTFAWRCTDNIHWAIFERKDGPAVLYRVYLDLYGSMAWNFGEYSDSIWAEMAFDKLKKKEGVLSAWC